MEPPKIKIANGHINKIKPKLRLEHLTQKSIFFQQHDYHSPILDNLSEGLVILDLDLTIIEINKYLLNIFQIDYKKVIRRKCHNVFFNRIEPCPQCPVEHSQIFSNGDDFTFDWIYHKPKRDSIHFRISGTPLRNHTQEITSVLLNFTNRTDLIYLNNYLDALSTITSLIFKNDGISNKTNEIIKIISQATNVNRTCWFENFKTPDNRIYAKLKLEWINKNTKSSCKNARTKKIHYSEELPDLYRQLFQGESFLGSNNAIHSAYFKNNNHSSLLLIMPLIVNNVFESFLIFESNFNQFFWNNFKIIFIRSVISFFVKALEHEKSINKLKESETRYLDIFENMDDAWFLQDLNGRFLEINPAFEKTTGYTKEELLSKSISDLIQESYRSQFQAYLIELKNKGKAEGVIHLIAKNGEEKIGHFRNWLVYLPGEKVVYRGLVKDVTDRVNLQAQLRHAQRMESMGTLASGISHNFRNILSGTMSFSQLIQMKYKHIPELQRYLDEIINLNKMGTHLISDLLKFSRKMPSDQKTFLNLSQILHETCHIIRQSFDKNISIQLDCPEIIPVFGDASTLSQVFMNLYTNARDAMSNGGIIKIQAKELYDKLCVSIKDSGCGIDPKIMNKIFDPFFTTKEPGKGTGLGLSTAYGIIKDLNGEIKVFSQLGLGSTFEIWLPRLETLSNHSEQMIPKLITGHGEKILIVDDDELILEPIEELFNNLGYQTSTVNNGKNAIEKYKQWRPDIVLLDRNMHHLDGISTAQMIIAFDPSAKIILVSGYEEDGPNGLDERVRQMIKGYLTKPLDIATGSRLINKVLNK